MVTVMSNRDLDIADMKCWVFHMAQVRWNMTPKNCAEIFKRYNVLKFIEECYDLLHLSSYECALNDVEELLRNQGVKI